MLQGDDGTTGFISEQSLKTLRGGKGSIVALSCILAGGGEKDG